MCIYICRLYMYICMHNKIIWFNIFCILIYIYIYIYIFLYVYMWL